MGAYVSSVTMSSYDHEPAHRAKMQRAAEYCTHPPPDWVSNVLSHFSFDVCSQHSIDQISKTRRKTLAWLAGVGKNAIDFSDDLRTPHLSGFLAANSKMGSEAFLNDQILSLSKLAAFARDTLPTQVAQK